MTRKKEKRINAEKQGWQTVQDDFGGSFGAGSPGSAAIGKKKEESSKAYQDPKETIKRHWNL